MEKDLLGVALVKRICRICGQVEDAEIVMNTKLSEFHAKEVNKMHGQVIGFLDKPCKECAEKFKADEYYIGIVIDETKTEDKENPYRTGQVAQIKKGSPIAKEMNLTEDTCKYGMFYLSNNSLPCNT